MPLPAPLLTDARRLASLCLLCLPCLQLIFADEDMFIDVGSIVVSGALRAGGPNCRLAYRLTLTFRSVPGIDPFDMVGGGGWRWMAAEWCLGGCCLCMYAPHCTAQ
jgi:hypothetical protein